MKKEILTPNDIKEIQQIVGALLYYGWGVDITIHVTLSAIAACQTRVTEEYREAAIQVLDYVASHPQAGIMYHKSAMILDAHADAGYQNETDTRSRVGAIFFLTEDDDVSLINGAVHIIAKIIKHVMSSAAVAEIEALFYTAQDGVILRQTLIEMGFHSLRSCKQDNTAQMNQIDGYEISLVKMQDSTGAILFLLVPRYK